MADQGQNVCPAALVAHPMASSIYDQYHLPLIPKETAGLQRGPTFILHIHNYLHVKRDLALQN